jgi:Zn-dependent peptidase ImmA (M78 family)/transcriptional regulator with XRE-family HTH domain
LNNLPSTSKGDPEMHDIAAALVALRELFGLSQSKLGKVLGLSQSALSKLESGYTDCTPDLVVRITRALGVAETFLDQEFDRCPMSATAFRKFSDVTQTQAKSIRALGSLVSERLRACFEITRTENNSSVRQTLASYAGEGPISMAARVRQYWGAGDGPIRNLTRLVEELGITVVHVELGIPRMDGLSLWPQGMSPLILLKAGAEGSRMRFTLAHELGHVLLHHGPIQGKESKDLEEEANQFASALLLPPEFKSELPILHDYWSYLALKARWGVSALAIIYRAGQLNMIDEQEHQKLYMYVSRLGYRKAEPNPLQAEQPSRFRQIGELALAACDGDLARFAARSFCTLREAEDWIGGKPVSLPRLPQLEGSTAPG